MNKNLVQSCAIVQSSIGGFVTLKVPSSRCDSCPGYCIRINRRQEIKLKGDFPIGAKVLVTVAADAMSIATLVTFGFPLIGLFVPLFWLENTLVAVGGLLLGIGIAVFVLKLEWMTRRLEPRVQQI